MSLGLGIHYCMGAALGRVEGMVAFELLLKRLANLNIGVDGIEWNETVAVRGLKRLRVMF